MKKLFILILLSMLLGACQSIPTNNLGRLPTGTVFHLNKPLRLYPSQVAIYFQFGQIVHPNTVDDYKPNCTIEVKHKLAHEQSIQPDTFRIDKVRYQADHAGSPYYSNYASFGAAPSFQEYATEIYLHSANQPNVYKLSCQHLEDPMDARHLHVTEMQQALGEIITISSPK